MKYLAALVVAVSLVGQVSAHCEFSDEHVAFSFGVLTFVRGITDTWPQLISGGTVTDDWEYVRFVPSHWYIQPVHLTQFVLQRDQQFPESWTCTPATWLCLDPGDT